MTFDPKIATFFVGAGVLGYAVWLINRAQIELKHDDEVAGLFRHFSPPQETWEGWIIDPRQGTLLDEISQRYGVRPMGLDLEALDEAGISVRLDLGTGEAPRLLKTKNGTWLQVADWNFQPVVFDPSRGVLRIYDGVLDPNTLAIQLLGL